MRRAPAKKRMAEAVKAVWTLKALQRNPTKRLERKSPTSLTAASVPKAMPCCSLGTNSAERESSEGFFRADVEPRKNENDREQRKRIRSGAKENRRDTGEGITSGEHSLTVRNVIAEPATRVSGAGIENVVERVKADGEAGGAGEAVSGRQRAGGVENQKRVGEISGAEDAYTEKQTPERWRQCF